MSYLRGFLPFIGFITLSHFGWQWGAVGAAVLAVAMLIADRRAGASWDTQILAVGSIAFFAVLTPIAFAQPHAAIAAYCGTMSIAWLAVVAWASIAIGTPFTMGIARRQVSSEVADSAAFRRLNVVITAAWASAFTVSAVLTVVLMNQAGWMTVAASATCFMTPILFTRIYVSRVRAAHMAPSDRVAVEELAEVA
ncbi:hypothetical protein [Williamsia maris]|uniref:DUF3159 domain-containing protein n=1 Tax=Williamsia maris TaxID=72806 RepID=A0ABT1HDN9_9NOCA|nr:hypothetical protein [Williamsia maris]MCP2175788.1 hypothetical protein [Williamsia maris]